MMNSQEYLVHILREHLKKTQTKNSKFSLRALALKLKVQPGALSEILNSKRSITSKVASKMLENLDFNPSVRASIIRIFPEIRKQNPYPFVNNYELSAEECEQMNNWLHYGLLIFMKTSMYRSDIPWLAKKFGVEANDIAEALKKLQKLNLVVKDANGEYKNAVDAVSTSDGVTNLNVRLLHIQDMQMAQVKLMEVAPDLRDFSSLVIPANPELLPRAKEILRKAQDDVMALMNDGNATEVYKVCTYFYPLTKNESTKVVN